MSTHKLLLEANQVNGVVCGRMGILELWYLDFRMPFDSLQQIKIRDCRKRAALLRVI
jgi:hypothetical protein